MKRLLIIALVCLDFLAVTGSGAAQNSENSKTNPVTVEGCPVPGVEAGCLMLMGADGKLWDITAAKPHPKPGRVVRITGEKSGAVTYCMQGIRLDHIQWQYTGSDCPKKS